MLVADNYRHGKTFTRATCVEVTDKTLEGSFEFTGVFYLPFSKNKYKINKNIFKKHLQ